MPKLNKEQLIDRLQKRITQLENGDLLESRDINALLNTDQIKLLEKNWLDQKKLRKIQITPKTEKTKKSIGWKTIREVRVEIYKKALEEAENGLLDSYEKRLKELDIKRAKIYLQTYFSEIKKGNDKARATARANNKLTTHGLRRIDNLNIKKYTLNKRDKEIKEMESILKKRFKIEQDENGKKE